MKLLRVGIKNYRSLGEDYVFLDLCKKINLLIGANNCGKSNVLRALELPSRKDDQFDSLLETDRHQRRSDVNIGFRFEIQPEEDDIQEVKQLELSMN